MRKTSKLSDALHMLLHMADSAQPLTSELLAKSVKTNSVVVRRIMAGLRDSGLVQSEKGHGGGWMLSCDLESTTLRDIYEAVGSPALLAIGSRDDATSCQVEQAVNRAAGQVFSEAETRVLEAFRDISLADLYESIKRAHC